MFEGWVCANCKNLNPLDAHKCLCGGVVAQAVLGFGSATHDWVTRTVVNKDDLTVHLQIVHKSQYNHK